MSYKQNLPTMEFLYEYAVIRFVPDIERQEFINVGLIMMCKRRRWVRISLRLDNNRIILFDPQANIDCLSTQLKAIEGIALGDKLFGPIALLEPEERFRWITAVKSACIQTSRPHPGLTDDLDRTFERLFDRLV